jgi:P-type Cu+ transporter
VPASLTTTRKDLSIVGMTCASCVSRVERALADTPGVASAAVNLATQKAAVVYDPALTNPEALAQSVRDIGYDIEPESTPSDNPGQPTHEETRSQAILLRVIAGGILSLPVVVIAMSHGRIPWLTGPWTLWLQFALTTPVIFWVGARFFTSAVKGLARRSANMDTLVALGTGAAYLYSTIALLWPSVFIAQATHAHANPMPQVYFEAAAVVIVLVLLGKYLEFRATASTTTAVKKLAGLAAKSATIERDGKAMEVPVEQVQVGDTVIIYPGAKAPVDAVVISGGSHMDEAMLTGESLPVEKTVGSPVYAGTLNFDGLLKARATKVGSASALAGIIRAVQEAQGTKPDIARLADKVSGIFVPIILLISLLTLITWLIFGPIDNRLPIALTTAVSVLVIACPCALGLATPTAVMVAIGAGARQGLLVRSGQALETGAKATDIVLDKTGTITQGAPKLTAVYPLEGWSQAQILSLAASVEQGSDHPLARAIVAAAAEQGAGVTNPESFLSTPGQGVTATVGGRHVALTKPGTRNGPLQSLIDQATASAATSVLVWVDSKPAGVIALADAIKPDSPAVIARLRKLGFTVTMLTGDSQGVAQAIARQAGIDHVVAGVTPQGKAQFVQSLQAQGKVVVMVGDGVNDAPALTQADLGIAIGTGADAGIQSGDITLASNSLAGVQHIIELSRRTMRIIRENLFWAFVYNLIGIPLAAGALYPFTGWLLSPIFASAAMALSSICVVLNSLRLGRLKSHER